jgi:hypothetical protein|tara:strand:- start:1928 stop:2110 length:183 start_codon:yes stop_codon:yes gene_type:complete
MTPTEQLTEIIRQILDGNVGKIHDMNLQSGSAREQLANILASQMIDSPEMVVIDTTESFQ